MPISPLRHAIFGVAMTFAGAAAAQQDAAAIAAQIQAETDAPGVIVGLYADGQTDFAATGLRALGYDAQVTTDDLWHVASNTKAITATLIARLAEAGMIDRDITINDALGERIPNIDPAYRDMGFAELLNHRSGLPTNIWRPYSWSYRGTPDTRDLPADRISYAAHMLSNAPKAAPPYPFAYSNAAYLIAGAMLETVTGTQWEALVETHVFAPLGVARFGFGAPDYWDTSALNNPRGHKDGWFGLSPVKPGPSADNIPALGPAGTVHVVIPDFMNYLRAHLTQDPDFLSTESWDWLHTARDGEDYAQGWVVEDAMRYHNGSNTMWFAYSGFNPDTGRIAIIVINKGGFDTVGPKLLDKVRDVIR